MSALQMRNVLAFCVGVVCGVAMWESRTALVSLTEVLADIAITPLYQSLMLTATVVLTAALLSYAILSARGRK